MTKPNVFIIESLSFEDEEDGRYEGEILSKILHLAEKESKYYYLRTKKELIEVLKIFQDSNYRYLHFSCHGDSTSLYTTLDRITFKRFGQIVEPYMDNKRLFVSACESVNDNLAKAVIPSTGCRSIVGPNVPIEFGDAAIIWASFYHLVFKAEPRKITRKTINPVLQKLEDTFAVSLNHFWRSDSGDYKHTPLKRKKS